MAECVKSHILVRECVKHNMLYMESPFYVRWGLEISIENSNEAIIMHRMGLGLPHSYSSSFIFIISCFHLFTLHKDVFPALHKTIFDMHVKY